MEFGLSKEQEMLQDSIRTFLQRSAPLERVKQFTENDESRASDIWTGLCDLGVPGIMIDEQYGGIGCELLDAALVAETLAWGVAPVPFVASVVMAPLALALAGSEEQKSRWLPALAEGRVIAGAAVTEAIRLRDNDGRTGEKIRAEGGKLHGKSLFVLDFQADLYLVTDENRRLYLVEANAPGLTRRALVTVDKTRRVGELVFDGVPAELLPGSEDPEICSRVIDAGRIILAADTLGAASRMIDKAIAYSKERVQFGRAIGTFQAVKHMCAEMASDLEPCRPMMWYAAYAFDHIPSEARLTACHTKAHLSEVATFIARTSTEVHGGIGFTAELGLHLWFKRIGANRQLLGGPDQVREEAARLQGMG